MELGCGAECWRDGEEEGKVGWGVGRVRREEGCGEKEMREIGEGVGDREV